MVFRLAFLTFLIAFGTFTAAQDSPEKSAKSDKSSDQGRSGRQDADKDPRSDRETREIFFRTLSETRSRGAQEFSYLLFQESVRKEINLGEDSAKAAREILSQTRSSAEKLYEQLKAKKITSEELKVKMQEIMTSADRDIWKTLAESNAKRDRLVELYVQHRKCSGVFAGRKLISHIHDQLPKSLFVELGLVEFSNEPRHLGRLRIRAVIRVQARLSRRSTMTSILVRIRATAGGTITYSTRSSTGLVTTTDDRL